MPFTRRTAGVLLAATVGILVAPASVRLLARALEARAGGRQDQPPTRRDLAVVAKDFEFSPSRLEVVQDDLVRLTVTSQDVDYSLTIDEYRVSRRVPAGGSTTLEFRASRAGTFPFYSNLTSDPRHAQMRGQLVVRGR